MSESDDTKNLQETADAFFGLLGSCVAVWADVDNELFRIFRHCLSAPLAQAAIVYYRSPGLDVRLEMTTELVESQFPKPVRESGGHAHRAVKGWRNMKTDFKGLLAVRRRIAHHPTRPIFEPFRAGESKVGELPPASFEIYIGEHEKLRAGEKPSLKLDDLGEHLKAVLLLRDWLRHFFYEALMPKPHSGSV